MSQAPTRAAQPFFEDLSPLDAFFLYAERPEAPLHIGGVYIFEGEPAAAGGLGALGVTQTLGQRLHLMPRYRQRVRFRPLNLGHPVWVDDPDFDLSYHVRRAALPAPGDDAALAEYASRVFARPLDMAKPLWELYVVEGLTGGRVALINKVHHAMVDGISAVDLGTLLFDATPDGPPPIAAKPWRPRPEPDSGELVLSDLRGLRDRFGGNPILLPFRLPQLARDAAGQVVGSPWAGAASLALSFLRPGHHLFFNRGIGPHRRLRHLAVPLDDLKSVKNVLACTVNDVVLAIVAEATQRWLSERDEDIPEKLRVFCPVSVRDQSQRYQLGNMVSGMIAELPLGEMPLVTRLARISKAMGDLKSSRQAVAANTLTGITQWAPATLHALAGRMAGQGMLSVQSIVNMVVTNVPGPQTPFYTDGARMLEVWPLVPIYHMLGMNLALVSYDGSVYFGLVADRDLVPDLDRFARHLEQAAGDYCALATRLTEAPAGRRRRSPSDRAR
jgi:diacylglycerol O-acyltransferase